MSFSTAGMYSSIENKVKTVDEILSLLGHFPRGENEIVHCHGTFDVVHPGHLRQLSYAKTQGKFLVVSITSDRFIGKAGVRPYVPQEMRLVNLSALSLVDYVILNDEETPIELIKELKPDIFIKGPDYSHVTSAKTTEEKSAVESYGGRMLFSPGDYVMSSTKLIQERAINLSSEKAKLLINQENLSISEFEKVCSKFKGTQVLLIGDTIVDRITTATTIGVSGKTPTISTKRISSEDFIGGAAIVALHLAAAGADVQFVTLLGNDNEGEWVREKLHVGGVKLHSIHESGRNTTLKEVFDVDGYRLLKMDRVNNSPISFESRTEICSTLKRTKNGLVIFSDFRHGMFDKDSCPSYVASLQPGVTSAADSQVASRWGNILDFAGVTLITANEKEARYSLGDQDSSLRPLGEALFAKSKAEFAILKAGRDGAIGYRRELKDNDPRHFFVLDSFARGVVDAVGAGDALLAYSSLAWHHNSGPVMASILGVAAASLECEKDGNHPLSPDEIMNRVREVLT
jgi:rfaE bifunctional protein nucleotidyltransferase chain/domain